MFDLTPLSRPVAVVEMLLMLTLAAFIGWLLARLLVNNRVNALRSAITDQEAELDDCRRSKITAPVAKARVAESTPARPITEEPITKIVAVVPPEPAVSYPASSDADIPTVPLADAPLALAPERPFVEPVTPAVPVPALTTPPVTGSSESAVLQRIAARASELNFDRIGVASAAEADDLKDIAGIGPFLERKLHSLGLYTFRQIAHFEKEDVNKVNDIIEFFPGRIERDNWVDQAKAFYERKYGKSVSR